MSRIKIIFRKGEQNTDFFTVIGPSHSHQDLESERLSGGLPLCIFQFVAEDAFGLVGPIRMLAAGMDLNDSAGAFARHKIKIICLALQNQLELQEEDSFQFNQTVAHLCRTHGQPRFHIERVSFTEAMHRLRQLDLLFKKMATGGTLNMVSDINIG